MLWNVFRIHIFRIHVIEQVHDELRFETRVRKHGRQRFTSRPQHIWREDQG